MYGHVPVCSVNDDAFGIGAHVEDFFQVARLGGSALDKLPCADELDRSDVLSVIIGKCLKANLLQLLARNAYNASSSHGTAPCAT